MMDAEKFEEAYQIMFRDGFAGYTPAVAEAPHGDGRVDAQKRYAHLNVRTVESIKDLGERSRMHVLLKVCMLQASSHAERLGIPRTFMPTIEDSTLRLLEYPPGATSAEHTDFDLFTINVYRSHPDLIVPGRMVVHLGELGELVTGTLATPHHVLAHETQVQRSAVFFAMPPLSAMLPTGMTVREWVAERKARSRVKAYEAAL